MINMQGVTKVYSNGVTALNGIDVHIEKGEFVYVVGPSGAGKTSFIKMMYREETATEGEVILDGQNLNKIKNKEIPFLRQNIVIVYEDFKLLPKRTVYENVVFALEVIEESPRRNTLSVIKVLDQVGLKHKVRFIPA